MIYLGKGNYASANSRSKEKLPPNETDKTVYSEIVANNSNYLDTTALLFLGKTVSYRTLIEQADKIADILISKGVKEGDTVLTCINGTPQSVSVLLACSKIGVCAMMLTPKTTEEMFNHVIDQCNGRFLFCMTQFYPLFALMSSIDNIENVIIMPADESIGDDEEVKKNHSLSSNIIMWAEFLQTPITAKSQAVSGGDHPFAICFTTGSTSIPKGIVLPNKSYIALEKVCRKIGWNWERGDIIFSIIPTFVASGISLVLLLPLCMGVAVLQEPRLNPFETFIYNLVTYKPAIVLATKSIWMSMAEALHDKYDLTAIKHAFTVGESISVVEWNTCNKFLSDNGAKAKLENMYGMSECNSIVTCHSQKQRSPISAGVSVPYATVAVFDIDTGKECPYGTLGEVYYQTPTVMNGYFMNQEATDAIFISDDHGEKWIKTGDIGYITDNGEIFVCCRGKERFTSADGVSIFPFLIEEVIKKEPNIKRCKMISTTYDGKPALAAHITLKNKINDDEIEAYIRKLHEMCKADSPLALVPKLYKYGTPSPSARPAKLI